METALILAGFVALLISVVTLNRKLNTIMATQEQEAAQLKAINDQFVKAAAEIVAQVQALVDALAAAGSTSPEVDAATSDLMATAQKLDGLNPDAPAETPEA